MSFEGAGGEKYDVHFTEENGRPVRAVVYDSNTGNPEGVITYRYDSKFFDGYLPVDISRYYGGVVDEKAKSYVLHIQSLKISNGHLASSILDPDKFINTTNPNYMPLFYSNNIPYWTDKNGNARRVLTAEENEKDIQRIKASQQK